MKTKLRLPGLLVTWLALAALLVTAFGAAPAAAETTEGGEWLLVFGNGGIHPHAAARVKAAGGEVLGEIPQIGVMLVAAGPDFEARAQGIPGAVQVGPNEIWEMAEPVEVEDDVDLPEAYEDNDRYFSHQWDIQRVGGIPETWEVTKGAGVRVAVLDTGVDYTHVDLAPNYVYGISYIDEHVDRDGRARPAEPPMDTHGHGTHVAGSIAASMEQGRIIGIAPEASIANYKVCASWGGCYIWWCLQGIVDAVDDGAHVINMSLGGPRDMTEDGPADKVAYMRAAQYARQNGTLLVAASGNNGWDLADARPTFFIPAGVPAAVSVNSTTSDDVRSGFSNYGPGSFISAPGSRTYSARPGNRYRSMSGTSMASPKVAGVAAIIIGANPHFNPAQVEALLYQTAWMPDGAGPGYDYELGFGIANAYRAVNLIRN